MDNENNWENSAFIDLKNSSSPEIETNTPITEIYNSNKGYTQIFTFRHFGKICILKALQPNYRGNSFYEQLLQKEFTIGYQLDHPHICHTLNWIHMDGLGNCILMEYIDGVTLRQFIDQQKLTPQLAIKFITELCEALKYIHNKQIIHRDLKPENILITYNGNNCKIIDFSLSDSDDAYLLKIPAGTKKYMDPELLLPGAKWNASCDIYSLGIIIQEMGCILKNKQLNKIAQKCTRKNKSKRYTTTEEIIQDLHKTPRVTPAILWASLSFVFILTGGGWFLLQSNNLNETRVQNNDISSFHTNTTTSFILDESCQKVINDAMLLPKEKIDCTQILNRLKEVLDQKYPLAIQRNTTVYKKEWEHILQEASIMLNEKNITQQ